MSRVTLSESLRRHVNKALILAWNKERETKKKEDTQKRFKPISGLTKAGLHHTVLFVRITHFVFKFLVCNNNEKTSLHKKMW